MSDSDARSRRAVLQRGERFDCDVLVLGSGVAGLVCALEIADARPEVRIIVVAKREVEEGNTRWAQGGIAAVATDDDSIEAHVSDTLAAGDGLCREAAVRTILEAAPACMERLVQRGVPFDQRPSDGGGSDFALALEGGHSRRRIYHSGDHTGRSIMETLVRIVRRTPSITLWERRTAVNLLTQTPPHRPGSRPEVLGAYLLEGEGGAIHRVTARLTVLATGGAGKVFRYTTNSETATGDGIAMAYRAGARVGNLEFYQFHPTLLYHPSVNNFLLTEALRGEGAYLRIPGSEERFMARYAPAQLELATRDKVARAIFTEMERQSLEHVWLDIRHREPEFLQAHFPAIVTRLRSLGIDLARDLVPVVPAAHYLCGGVLAEVDGRCDLDRLLVIGECAFTGLHGANRLASNSLIEGVVMGTLAARSSPEWLDAPPAPQREPLDWDSHSVSDARRASQISAQWRGLRNDMSSFAGIVRTEAGLRDLSTLLDVRRSMIEEYYWRHVVTRDLVELRNLALVAELIARSALHRRESRGGHFREDFPDAVPESHDTVLRQHEEYPNASSHFERPTR